MPQITSFISPCNKGTQNEAKLKISLQIYPYTHPGSCRQQSRRSTKQLLLEKHFEAHLFQHETL